MYYVKQMNNGCWYVLRTARSTEPVLRCENALWISRDAAEQAMLRELRNRGLIEKARLTEEQLKEDRRGR